MLRLQQSTKPDRSIVGALFALMACLRLVQGSPYRTDERVEHIHRRRTKAMHWWKPGNAPLWDMEGLTHPNPNGFRRIPADSSSAHGNGSRAQRNPSIRSSSMRRHRLLNFLVSV